jgi:hypothetical protein
MTRLWMLLGILLWFSLAVSEDPTRASPQADPATVPTPPEIKVVVIGGPNCQPCIILQNEIVRLGADWQPHIKYVSVQSGLPTVPVILRFEDGKVTHVRQSLKDGKELTNFYWIGKAYPGEKQGE